MKTNLKNIFAMTALTLAEQNSQAQPALSEPTVATALAPNQASFQDIVPIIREEIRQAIADASPEAQRTREEAVATAEILNMPENRVAYQSASDRVYVAMAAKRWTEKDKEAFQDTLGLLTDDQRMELINVLIPAINRGEVKVETIGPLF